MVGDDGVLVSASMLQNADYSRIFFPGIPQLPVIGPFLLAVLVALLFGLVTASSWPS